MFHAHIGAMDAFARGLTVAARIRADGVLDKMVRDRYCSYTEGIGEKIEAGKTSFVELEKYMLEKGEATRTPSGRQELIENIINEYL